MLSADYQSSKFILHHEKLNAYLLSQIFLTMMEKRNSHLVPTRNQQLPVDTNDNFHGLVVLSSQLFITPLLKIASNLKKQGQYSQFTNTGKRKSKKS